ncbi:hypothetical protein ACJRO7_000583 [Eucalyptus globulus]|uniref:Uncharacterized protein n=1 Tax=Eucalyptus globulus TaxID=34317 RepID=A0ABD3LP24_EUCGL
MNKSDSSQALSKSAQKNKGALIPSSTGPPSTMVPVESIPESAYIGSGSTVEESKDAASAVSSSSDEEPDGPSELVTNVKHSAISEEAPAKRNSPKTPSVPKLAASPIPTLAAPPDPPQGTSRRRSRR